MHLWANDGLVAPDWVSDFFFSSRRRHTRFDCDWSSDVCSSDLDHWKAKGLDFSQILYQPAAPPTVARRCVRAQDHGLEKALDQTLISLCSEAIEIGRASCRERV